MYNFLNANEIPQKTNYYDEYNKHNTWHEIIFKGIANSSIIEFKQTVLRPLGSNLHQLLRQNQLKYLQYLESKKLNEKSNDL